MKLKTNCGISGTSLVEACIAAGTAALCLGSLFTMNMQSMKTLRVGREAAAASQVLQQRIETMRIANWHQVTDANWIQTNLLNSSAPGSTSLKDVTETFTLIPYGSETVGNTQVVRSNGSTQIINQNGALLKEGAIKVICTVAYTGGVKSGPVSRQVVAILAKGGVAKW